MLEELNSITLDLVKGLAEETKKRLAYELRTGLLNGESIQKLSERVRNVFETSKTRAVSIARTESVRVFNTASIRRYQNAGVKKWKWYAAVDERTCPVCGTRHNRVYDINDAPPPAHPQCRCTVVPVLDGPERAEKPFTEPVEVDERIGRTLNEFEKILKEDGTFTRSVCKFVNGKKLSFEEAEREFTKIYGKHIKGASRELKEHLKTKLVTRISPRVIERTNLVKIKNKRSGRSFYNPLRKEISLVTEPKELQWHGFLHEYGHHLEYELYKEKVVEFYIARVKKNGYKIEPLRKLYNYELPFGMDEYAFVGFDIEPYAGKFYVEHSKWRAILNNPKKIEEFKDQISTEVLSVGLQYFENENTMKELYEKDRELFGFMLTLLRGDFL